MRRTSRPVVVLAAASTLLLLAAQGPTTIPDPCGGGLRPVVDICGVVIEPTVTEIDNAEHLQDVRFTLIVDAETASWSQGDMWDIMWRFGDCTWAIRWFHDPGSDLPRELTTRLDRNCGNGALGFEVEAPTLGGRTLSSTISIDVLRQLDPAIGLDDTLAGLKAHTYGGVGMQPPIYPYVQASYESDDTEAVDVVLE